MKIRDIIEHLDATVYCGESDLEENVNYSCCADLMSDVLADKDEKSLLITGLVNVHVLRTAEMMDMPCVVFVRGKTPTEEMIELAKELDITVLSTHYTSYTACGILYTDGLKGARRR